MKQLLKAWKEYKGSLKPINTETAWTSVYMGKTYRGICQTTPMPSFEGFMDYLVRKEKKGKRK